MHAGVWSDNIMEIKHLEDLAQMEDTIKMDMRKMGCQGVIWNHVALDMHKWWALVTTIMKPLGSTKCGEFLDQLQNCQFLRNDSVPWGKEVNICICITYSSYINEISLPY